MLECIGLFTCVFVVFGCVFGCVVGILNTLDYFEDLKDAVDRIEQGLIVDDKVDDGE